MNDKQMDTEVPQFMTVVKSIYVVPFLPCFKWQHACLTKYVDTLFNMF